jgi:replication factor C subunit 2/4
MNQTVNEICAAGYSAQALLATLLPKVIEDTDGTISAEVPVRGLSELSKAQIAIRIAESEKNMIEGADEYLQLMTVCCLIFSCFQKQGDLK